MHDFVTHLKHEYSRRTSVNPSYSLRAFARDLTVSPSLLSDLFHGKKKLSSQREDVIKSKLGWTHFRAKALKKSRELGKLTWYHLAILEFVHHFDTSPESDILCKSLGLSKTAFHLAVETLMQHKLLKLQRGVLKTIPDRLFFGNHTPSEEIRNFHKDFLELAARRLELTQFNEREYSSTVFSLSHDQTQELRLRLRKVVEEFECLASQDKPKPNTTDKTTREIYGFSAQLFRITNHT